MHFGWRVARLFVCSRLISQTCCQLSGCWYIYWVTRQVWIRAHRKFKCEMESSLFMICCSNLGSTRQHPAFHGALFGSQVLTAIHFAPLVRTFHCIHFAKQSVMCSTKFQMKWGSQGWNNNRTHAEGLSFEWNADSLMWQKSYLE